MVGSASANQQNNVAIDKSLLKRRLETLKETVLHMHERGDSSAKRAKLTPQPNHKFVPVPEVPIQHPSEVDDQFSSTAERSVSKLLFVEIFSGTAGLTAAVRSFGIQGIGIDSAVNTSCKSPILRLDLTTSDGQEILWNIIKRPTLCGIHLGPPCGTASKAREIRSRRGPDPRPLRSPNFPDGIPSLGGLARAKVLAANTLYQLTAQVLDYCVVNDIPISVENPLRSYFWDTKHMKRCRRKHHSKLYETVFHHCMYGSERRKATMLLHNCRQLCDLECHCDDSHPHLPWGYDASNQKWATSCETEYPVGLCKAYALSFHKHILAQGFSPLPQSLTPDALQCTDAKISQIAAGKQPKGKKVPPLVSEFSAVFTATGLLNLLPHTGKLTVDWPIPHGVCVRGPYSISSFPAHSKVLRSKIIQGDGLERKGEVAIGIYWEPSIFVKLALDKGHPRDILQSVPVDLRRTIDEIVSKDVASTAKSRTAIARKWMLRASDLAQRECDFKSTIPDHCAKILKSKRMLLFAEMLSACNHPDDKLCQNICQGFDLLGDLPSSNVFNARSTFATLTPDQVRATARLNREAIFNSVGRDMDQDICEGVYDATLKELGEGWLDGPIDVNALSDEDIVTRRFGVKQFSTESDGTRSCKVRPIDDYTESLVNLTNGSSESIVVHGIDFILAAVSYRLKALRDRSMDSELCAKTIDLRKAYKQLPLSEGSLSAGYLCVKVPSNKGGGFELYRCKVLPFGARAAVNGFCRTSHAIWMIGVRLFKIRWSCYFDDFFIVENPSLAKHSAFIVDNLFSILGWATSNEKNSKFDSFARALGVTIDLADTVHLSVKVANTRLRGAEIADQINGILERTDVKKTELETLRGRLIFAESQIFGRLAHKALREISSAISSSLGCPITDHLREALSFLASRVVNSIPREVLCGHRSVIHLYTDACHEEHGSGVGGVMYDQTGKETANFGNFLTPSELDLINLDDRKTIIAELESLAVLMGVDMLSKRYPHHDAIVFVDNDAGLAAMIRVTSHNQFMLASSALVAELECDHGLRLWFERVPSHSNPADLPSRGDFSQLDQSVTVSCDTLSFVKSIDEKRHMSF